MLEKSERAYEKVINYIKDEIRVGNLKRGESLPPERELAELLGVSRNSVREAVRTMSLRGFVSSVQGAGNFVTCDLEKNFSESLRIMLQLGETNFLQISQMRRGLESETARLACARILPGQLARLEYLVDCMQREQNPDKASHYDQEFHSLLCEAAGNRLIKAMFGAMLSTVNEFIATMYAHIVTDEAEGRALHDAHCMIVAALRAHDEDAAVQAIYQHFEVVNRSIIQRNI